MKKKINTKIAKHLTNDKFHLKWITHPSRQHERGKWWYVLVILTVFAFLAYGIVDQNWSLIVGISALVLVYIVIHRKATEEIEVEVELNKNGLKVGKRLYRYSDMNHFWIFHELSELHIRLNNTMGMPVSISVPEDHLSEIEEYMHKRVPERKTSGEVMIDTISYFFKL